ncbi:class I SAM-dependent methyltransferase [bacterium]|nr:class I SAM-dependent methyltransferase [bacterium]
MSPSWFRRSKEPPRKPTRESLAATFLRGEGIEIGALNQPTLLPPDLRVRYVDRFAVADLKNQYPELANADLVDPDIVDDGETLGKIDDASQDFVLACHFLEHCENPLKALENMVRVLRPGGILFLAIPDKRFTFDIDRPITPLEHLVRDYEEGPEWSREPAYWEWAQIVDKLDDVKARYQVEHYMGIRYSIHFHAWTPAEMAEMFVHLQRGMGVPADIKLFYHMDDQVIALLEKQRP